MTQSFGIPGARVILPPPGWTLVPASSVWHLLSPCQKRLVELCRAKVRAEKQTASKPEPQPTQEQEGDVKIDTMFPSRFLCAADLTKHPQGGRLTIKNVVSESMRDFMTGDSVSKYVLYFEGHTKGMVLGKAVTRQIAKSLGNETDDWMGKEITLFVDSQKMFGETKPVIRARAAHKFDPVL